jgi:RP/EB family microtubule-associated protein
LHKVKFDAKHEYEYIANFKVLQLAFEKHQIDKIIPGNLSQFQISIRDTKWYSESKSYLVERLVKCRSKDNIEFCQWVKRFHGNYLKFLNEKVIRGLLIGSLS